MVFKLLNMVITLIIYWFSMRVSIFSYTVDDKLFIANKSCIRTQSLVQHIYFRIVIGVKMSFKAALDDIQFNLFEMGLLKQIQVLPGFEEITDDIVPAVLEENAKFVEEQLAPLNKVGDMEHAQWSNGEVKSPTGFKDAFKAYTESGWQALQHEVEYGGQGFPKLIAAATSENLHAANMSFGLCPMLTDGCVEAIRQAGSEQQKNLFIPPLLDGRWTGTMNLTEPQAGSDLALVNSKAIRQEDGTYRLFGQKIFITYGEHDMSENIIHLVLARTPDAPKGVKGISLFVVPKFLVNEDGSLGKRNDVFCTSIEHKLGIHASPTAVLVFGDNKGEVGEGAVAYLVGEENAGLSYMFIMMNEARFNVGIQGIAVSERASQQALAYAKERLQGSSIDRQTDRQAGPVPIIHHPDVQRMLQTMQSLTQGARAIALYAATAHDLSTHHTDDTVRGHNKKIQEYLVPIVKGFSTEMSLEVTSLGVQVHGGMGFIEETGAAQYYRDARILPIYEGTTAIQANDFIGRKTLRDNGEVALYFVAEMKKTREELQQSSVQHAKQMADYFSNAITAYQSAIETILDYAVHDQLREAYAVSVPFLMLAGYVHSAWHFAKAALVSQDKGTPFNKEKQQLALFYMTQVLPRVTGLSETIKASRYVPQMVIRD